MTVVVTHSTLADGSFSAEGAAAWDANHTLTGIGTMAEQDANNVNITGGSISGISGLGTVTSVAASGGTTGLTFSGPPITSSGTLTLGGTLVVGSGGTGASAFTSNGVLLGNGTSAVSATAAGTTGQILVGNTGSAPTWATLTNTAVTSISFGTTGLTPSTATQGAVTVAGTLAVANGGTGVTTSTGTGSVVLSNSPTLVTPTLGAASATSIANGLGAVGTPSYTFTGDTNTGMWSPAADTIAFSENGVEAMRLDSSGNVGIGTTAPSRRLEVVGGTLTAGTQSSYAVGIANSGGANGDLTFGSDGSFAYIQSWAGKPLTINGQGNEVRIAGTTDQGAYNLQVNGTGVWGAGAYVNGSDRNLKEEIAPLADALDVVNALKPVTFRYKEDYSKDQSIQPGFIAQELQEVLANQVYLGGVVHAGPEHLNVAYQSLIPVLVKAIQELTARVAELEEN